ncbi:hypothetical protein N0V88_006870 [Collariella sp. IMI 366227]|nr:hypothetical protein N0V88_006870 [Collariella sp. IMI 366227]
MNSSRKRHHGPDSTPETTRAKAPKRRKAEPLPPSTITRGSTTNPDLPHIKTPPEEEDSDTPPDDHDHDDDSPDHCHSRKRHNLVEQKYRQRLNSQFKQLLDILPASMRDAPDGQHGSPPTRSVSVNSVLPSNVPLGSSNNTNRLPPLQSTSPGGNGSMPVGNLSLEKGDRRVSKGEVLDRARMYIQALEREHRRLVAERRELDLMWEESYRRREAGAAGGQDVYGRDSYGMGGQVVQVPQGHHHHAGMRVLGHVGVNGVDRM